VLGCPDQHLPDRARRCHGAVRALREAVASRVGPLIAAPATLPVGEPVPFHDLIG
jgi:hypothetical protein